jgi:hypothetical protein
LIDVMKNNATLIGQRDEAASLKIEFTLHRKVAIRVRRSQREHPQALLRLSGAIDQAKDSVGVIV